MQFITERSNKYVQYMYLGCDDVHFIACDGCFSDEDIETITAQLEESEFPKGHGDYMYKVSYEPAQLGEYGAVEIAEYFELDEVLFRPMSLNDDESLASS